jgi:hypothetical protein
LQGSPFSKAKPAEDIVGCSTLTSKSDSKEAQTPALFCALWAGENRGWAAGFGVGHKSFQMSALRARIHEFAQISSPHAHKKKTVPTYYVLAARKLQASISPDLLLRPL